MKNKYTITKEQILELKDPIVKEWFPDVFKKEYTTGWYKHTDNKRSDWIVYVDFSTGKYFGLGAFSWIEKDSCLDGMLDYVIYNKCIKATKQEVFEALKKEAVKRGFKKRGGYFKCLKNGNIISCDGLFGFSTNTLYSNRGIVFDNGKFAEIIPTLTKEEAEEKFNVKII